MYVWHKFWGRKTWNVVAEYIKTYCPEGGIVLDPFAGSGIVAMEALKAGRKAIVCDLLPIATEITRLTLKPVGLEELRKTFERVARHVKSRILELYTTSCRNCRYSFPFTCAVWQRNRCIEIRYEACPRCGDRQARACGLTRPDTALLQKIERMQVKAWYPRNRLSYPDGTPFKEKQRYESLDELFTRRNLIALAWLMEAIEEEPRRDLRDFLKVAFTSMVHLCSRMVAISNPLPTSHHTPFSSTGWTQQSYWHASSFMEQNVWEKFESAVLGHQGLLNAKAESNEHFSDVKFARSLEDVLEGRTNVYIHCGDALDMMRTTVERHGPCVDYIFTDPPYDASVQYGELAYLWIAWLRKDAGYVDRLLAKEIVRNERQQKAFDVYHALLRNAFRLMHDFHKSPTPGMALRPEEIDAARFERIVIETAKRVLAERGEETPYTILINAIDPELARNGYFSELRTGLDVRAVLESRLGQEFVLVPMRLGGVEGKAWWFRDPSSVPRLETVPLSERVEQTVLRKLQERGRVTFTDMWKAISEEFPNALTTDSTSIKDALQAYGRPVGRGEWLLKSEYNRDEIRRTHTRIIAILAEVGKAHGADVWIGRPEQGDPLSEGFPGRQGELRQYATRTALAGLENAGNIQEVENIDVLWLRGGRVEAVFEVDATTSMTEALKRGSNVHAGVPKYLVIPQEREDQLIRKLRSPLFGERFQQDSWRCFFSEVLDRAFERQRGKLDINTLVAKKVPKASTKNPDKGAQLKLFEPTPRQDNGEGNAEGTPEP